MSEVWTSEAAWAIYGVVAGVVLTVCLDLIRHWLGRRSRGADLARRAVVLLDAYIEGLADVAERDSIPYVSSGSFFPEPPLLPDGVDWASINKQLAYDLLKLPAAHTRGHRYLRFLAEVEGDDEVFKARRIEVTKMAHAANDCALKLRKRYRLPSRNADGGWDPMPQFPPLAES